MELADLLAEVSTELRGPDGRVRPLAPAGAPAAEAAPARQEPAEEAPVPAAEPEPALALVGTTRAAHRAGGAVALAA